jgi:hypothetical protein
VVAIALGEVIALRHGDMLVTFDRRILVTIVDHHMPAALEHLAELHDLLGEGATRIFGGRDGVGNTENVEAVPCHLTQAPPEFYAQFISN